MVDVVLSNAIVACVLIRRKYDRVQSDPSSMIKKVNHMHNT